MSATPVIVPQHRRIAALMAVEAASLAVASALHLSGLVHGRGQPFSAVGAGIAEAVICVVLAAGASALARRGAAARPVALAATGFAIAGFLYGLSVTTRGGDAPDIAYHATVLPLLVVTFLLIARFRRSARHAEPGAGGAAAERGATG